MSKEKFIEIHCGDCLDILPLIPFGSVTLVVADLPYGTTRNKWDSLISLDVLWAEFLRVGLSNAVFVFTASQPFTSTLVMSQPSLFRHEWIWIKNRGSNFANTVREPFKEHESVLVFSRGKWTYNRQMQERTGSGASRVKYDFNCRTASTNYGAFGAPALQQGKLRVPSSWQKFNTEVGLHPTQKPIALIEYFVRTYSNPGDLVLDPTMGSGTTGLACINLGRRFIGIERDAEYFATSKNRLASAQKSKPETEQKDLFVV